MNQVKKDHSISFIYIVLLTILFSFLYQKVETSFYSPIALTIELKSQKNDECRVFYRGYKQFRKSRSLFVPYQSKEEYQLVHFNLPLVNIRELIIAPGQHSSWCNIKQVTLELGDQKKNFSGKEILEYFQIKNTETSELDLDQSLLLQCENNCNVQMVLKGTVTDYFETDSHKLIKHFWFIFIGLMYLIGIFITLRFGQRLSSRLLGNKSMISTLQLIDQNYNLLKFYLIKNKKIFIYFLLLAAISFGYELFNFSLSIDEEIDSFSSAEKSYWYLSIGRWGIYYLKYIFYPESIIPYYPFLITLTCIALSGALFITNESGNFGSKILFGILFISHPIHSYYLAFNTTNLFYGMGMVLSTISFLLFKKGAQVKQNSFMYFIVAVLLLAFALSLYQALLSFFIVFVVFHLFNKNYRKHTVNWRKILTYIIRLALVVVSSVVVYKVVGSITEYIVIGQEPQGSPKYLDDFFAWGKEPIFQIITGLGSYIWWFLTGVGSYENYIGVSSRSTFVLFIVLVYYRIKKPGAFWAKMCLTICLIALILSAFSLSFLNGMALPYRTMMSFPLMIGILWFYTYKQSGAVLKKIMLVAAFAILINNTYTNTRLFYSSHVSWQADRDMANRIIERIYTLDPPLDDGKIEIAFVGHFQHNKNLLFINSDVHGASFFEWNNGKPQRMIAFFKTIGIGELKIASREQIKEIENKIDLMPCWPKKGSVDLIDRVIVVKLSE